MICTPGIDIIDIAEKLNLSEEEVSKFLEDEYLKHDLTFGRRLCCRC